MLLHTVKRLDTEKCLRGSRAGVFAIMADGSHAEPAQLSQHAHRDSIRNNVVHVGSRALKHTKKRSSLWEWRTYGDLVFDMMSCFFRA